VDLREPGGHSLKARLDAYERRIIVETLGTSKSIRESARKLGVSHTTLLNRLRKHQISMAR
jgi:TyrR family helix-turn-helix protein